MNPLIAATLYSNDSDNLAIMYCTWKRNNITSQRIKYLTIRFRVKSPVCMHFILAVDLYAGFKVLQYLKIFAIMLNKVLSSKHRNVL